MTRLFWLVPGLLAIAPKGVLDLLGARADVATLTGTLPPDRAVEALALGLAYVAAHLLAWSLGPPLIATGLVLVLRRPPPA